MFKLFSDAANILADVQCVVSHYTDLPPHVAQFSRDLVISVLHRDPVQVSHAIVEAQHLLDEAAEDNAAAGDAWAKLVADLKALLADLA